MSMKKITESQSGSGHIRSSGSSSWSSCTHGWSQVLMEDTHFEFQSSLTPKRLVFRESLEQRPMFGLSDDGRNGKISI